MNASGRLTVGDEIGSRTVTLCRSDLVRYAGASGDFNQIHYSEAFARGVQLPGVIAHGMLTMGVAIQLVVDWLGDPTAIQYYQCRFTGVVPVPDSQEGVQVRFVGVVTSVDEDRGSARIDLTATLGDVKVLGRAYAVVTLA